MAPLSPKQGLAYCVILAALFAGQSAYSVTPEMPFEISPVVGYRFGGSIKDDASSAKVELDNSPSIGLILNLREDVNTQWEIMYAYQPTEIDIKALTSGVPASLAGARGSDIDIHQLQFGGTYIAEGTWARPFMAATVGVAHIDPDFPAFDSDTYIAFSIAAGYKLFPTKRVGVRLEGRVYGTVIDSDSNIFCTSGVGGANCLFEVQGEVLWQWDVLLGATFRF